ncbi:Cellulose synthase (UDP-forming) [Handroanthus impetiginosus]|uniref:Cellulose synthase (UDP-forming) n=1 Tax=Handroanthus impetiginosus TaxID=429701 RepID=A0A2G9GR97_9LAMI|nr:Cellulose synthase (UDP-forming) [Handroanthus impetiginosus]
MKTTAPPPTAPLHSVIPSQRRHFNRLFAAVYAAALLFLFHHHILSLLHSATITSILLFISDIILAYMWSTCQAFRMNPVYRQSFPENLEKILDRRDFPAMDIFICTADPYKEPPIDVVNTALSVMAYDYPAEKLSVYVSDDGGSELTMFAFMEAAKFGKLWLPFCRENNIADRCPDAYFSTNYALSAKTLEIKMMYESMKIKIENAVERGKISDEYISSDEERKVLNQYWSKNFSRQNHPTVIQVLLNTNKDVDSTGGPMPDLIYVSREKRKAAPHHFKAGALNALLRVSATMTNSPIVLTLDCDMYSNDPLTAQRLLCYLPNRSNRPNCGYVQFPQRYHGLNEADIYASEHKRLFRVNPFGMDGLNGPNYVGTGCFFLRRVFFGGPSKYVRPEIPELGLDHVVDKPIDSPEVLGLAHRVAGCNCEDQTDWGSKMGFRYGSLVEDYYTGYRLKCEGWQSIFCDPIRPAFLGDVPFSLNDALGQVKRWSVGLLEVGFSKYSPITLGMRSMGLLMGLGYAHYAFWPIWSIPVTIYAFLPSLALLQGIPIFPKVYDPLFFVYTFLFLGAYGEDCLDFISTQGTFQRWWSDQRMWLMRSLSAFLFGSIEYTMKRLGMATHGFNITSKVVDDEQGKRYAQGVFEFGIPSPMFVPLAMAAILNLIAFFSGFVYIMKERSIDSLVMQMFIAGFGVMNGLPFYEAMVLRRDKGRMPTKTTITSILLLGLIYGLSYFVLRN